MAQPWRTLATVSTPEGPLELRQRGERDFLIVIDGRVLMTTMGRRSEIALATLGCAQVVDADARVLIGGLGMGYTLCATLDVLGAGARIAVAELQPEIVDWCRGPLRGVHRDALADPRVSVEIADVADVIARAGPGTYDAILLDLYEGPHAATQSPASPFYGHQALARSRAALAPGGTLAIWSEDADREFERRFAAAGFQLARHRIGGGGRAHIVYTGRRG